MTCTAASHQEAINIFQLLFCEVMMNRSKQNESSILIIVSPFETVSKEDVETSRFVTICCFCLFLF